jgi:hypothetical protein
MSSGIAGPGRRALLIGINEYRYFPQPLRGCVNDVQVLSAILRDGFGFAPNDISILCDADATRAGILSECDRLVDVSQTDDVVVIAYSGHGSRMTDREGDEADGWDETLVPYDSGRAPHTNRDITDDELFVWLRQLTFKTPFVTLIFDCCHSGTVARDPFGPAARWVQSDDRPVAELPRSTVGDELARSAWGDVGPSGWLPLAEQYVLIAGCRDEESSYEISVVEDGSVVTHGALTYFLGRELAKARSGTTYRDVFEAMSARVTAAKPGQHPQLEGARDRELFGVKEINPVRFVGVGSRAGDSIVLKAGLAHGVSTGSRWTVYPPGTKDTGSDTGRLGAATVTEVRAVTANAAILKEVEANSIAEGARAIEDAHDFGDMRLTVLVRSDDARAEGLRKVIGDSSLLRVVDHEQVADYCVYLVPARAEAGPENPAPQLGALYEDSWVVVGADGLVAMRPRSVAEAAAPATVRRNLEKAARYRNALALRNPDAFATLTGQVDLVLKRRGRDGRWKTALPDAATGHTIYEEGDAFGAEILNRHSAPVHASVLDFGLAGAIGLVYPIAGAREALAAGHTAQIGMRAGYEIELVIPAEFSSPADPARSNRAEGTETFKLIATTGEADFSGLVQEGFRDARPVGTASPLEKLMRMALTGDGTRDVVRVSQSESSEEWTTLERIITLRRRR